jgi:hypothetical protein
MRRLISSHISGPARQAYRLASLYMLSGPNLHFAEMGGVGEYAATMVKHNLTSVGCARVRNYPNNNAVARRDHWRALRRREVITFVTPASVPGSAKTSSTLVNSRIWRIEFVVPRHRAGRQRRRRRGLET